jgi:hypothetical protein
VTAKRYSTLTTTSLIVIAVSAILYDRIPGYGWVFGGLAAVCGALSAWLYLAHGMNKDRVTEVGTTGVSEQANEIAPLRIENSNAGITVQGKPFDVDVHYVDFPARVNPKLNEGTGKTAHFVYYANSLRMSKLASINYFVGAGVAVRQGPRQRTFAEEVMEIIKGLSTLGETPLYELEFKSDGTLRVFPCTQNAPRSQEPALPEDVETTETPKYH